MSRPTLSTIKPTQNLDFLKIEPDESINFPSSAASTTLKFGILCCWFILKMLIRILLVKSENDFRKFNISKSTKNEIEMKVYGTNKSAKISHVKTVRKRIN